MILVAITGTICSGKSFISKIIKKSGYPVFSCDEEICKILNQKMVLKKLSLQFPQVLSENSVNKRLLAEIVFKDHERKQILEDLLYPKLFEKQNKFIETFKKRKSRIAFFEVPLLYEKNLEKQYSCVIVTYARVDIFARRAIDRKIDQKIFCNILKNQMPSKEKENRADYVINTGCSKKEVEDKIKEIINKIFKNERNHS